MSKREQGGTLSVRGAEEAPGQRSSPEKKQLGAESPTAAQLDFAELLELACELYDFLRPGSSDEMPGEYEAWLRAREVLGRHHRVAT